jgi:hypothetical protein
MHAFHGKTCLKMFSIIYFSSSRKMGRVNKRIAASKKVKADKATISTSAVLKTLANEDKKQDNNVQQGPELVTKVGVKVLLLQKPTAKSFKAKNKVSSKITKKDKMKLRKDNLVQRLEVMKDIKKEEKAKAIRMKKVITGDMKPMVETLDAIFSQTDDVVVVKKKPKTKKAERPPTKMSQKNDQMMKDLAIFEQVVKHPQYAKNPFATITTHIENKMLLEAMEADE